MCWKAVADGDSSSTSFQHLIEDCYVVKLIQKNGSIGLTRAWGKA